MIVEEMMPEVRHADRGESQQGRRAAAQLGIDLSGVTTRSSLSAGLRAALNVVGLEVTRQA